jgi:hypothetical protein
MSTIIDKLNDEAFNDYQSRDAGNPQNQRIFEKEILKSC